MTPSIKTPIGRVPPHSVEAEEQLLSACMIDDGTTLSRALAEGIRSTSFYVPANRVVFDILAGLHADGKPVELPSVYEALKDARKLEEIGGYAYLTRVSDRVPTTAGALFSIERVAELSQLRCAINAATALVENAYAYTGDGVSAHLGRDIERITESVQARATARSWTDIVAEAKAITAERMKPEDKRSKAAWSLSWAWANLDTEFQAMEPGELVVVAARPSVGKSTIARMQAVFTAQRGFPCLFSSLEVTDTELAINLVANVTGVRSRRDLASLHAKEAGELMAGFDELSAIRNFSVCHTDEWLAELLGRASSFKARYGLALWVIDYLQLVADCQTLGRGETEALAIGRVTRALKRFAVREGCVVMLLSQLNRDSERDNREPRLSDLRGSGSIEQDANRIMFLHRPDEVPAEFSGSGMAEDQCATDDRPWHFVRFIQAKGRNHGTGMAGLRLDRATATFKRLTHADPK